MSIANIIHKIKGKTGIDRVTVLYLCIIMGVGISSFGLGRLSINDNNDQNNLKSASVIETTDINIDQNNNVMDLGINSGSVFTEKRYVASKNGKLYYSLDCSGAKRIKIENAIYFSTKEEAEKSGFALSTTCK